MAVAPFNFMKADSARSEAAELRRRLAEAEAERDAAERRYEELVHRVKNEFQQVSAMTRLQAAEKADPDACLACAARVNAFAELHALLDAGSGEVAMSDYLGSLERMLGGALAQGFRFETRVAGDVRLDFRRASQVGMIVAEAALNAAKHAFGENGGRCMARLERIGERLQLTVRADGAGYSEDARPGRGARLIEGLAAQLRGELDYPPTPAGTTLRVRFSAG